MPRSEPDHLVDARAAALLVAAIRQAPCAPGTIWSWASRGHIQRHGRGRYDVRDVESWTRRLLMDDLIEWLRAQLDDDERVAREAYGHHVFDGTGIVVERYATGTRSSGVPSHVARQLARWDPPRVLAEVEAKRRILDLHASYGGYGEHCATCTNPDDDLAAGAPCPCTTVRLIAQPYAGRPGWRDAWAPNQHS